MHLALGTVHELATEKALLVLAVIAIAIFGRLILRIILVVVAAALLVALTYGAVTLIQTMHG
jgi:hypothetical protein